MKFEISKKKKRVPQIEGTYSLEQAFDLTNNAIDLFLSSLNSPRALSISIIINSGVDNYHELYNLPDVNPKDYNDSETFRLDYIASQFLAKNQFLPGSGDKVALALEKFEKFEQQCCVTNDRLSSLCVDFEENKINTDLLHRMTRKIHKVIGPSISPEEFIEGCDWGPGTTQSIKMHKSSKVLKYRDERGMSRDLHDFVMPWFAEAFPLWGEFADIQNTAVIQNMSKVITVPKNAKIDRVICVEPGFNLFFQKSLGSFLRRRLLKVGINLNSQERNQKLARKGSIDGSLATIDFSSASDSIARKLVEITIPNDFYNLLNVTRTKYRMVDGRPQRWEKFSSMGNGFTFELESLLFYGAATAVCEYLGLGIHNISVFGDDVILPVEAVPLFLKFCSFIGFTVNEKKSFWTTHFRESCGEHYYGGLNCKPIFLKRVLNEPTEIIKLANNVRRLAHRFRIYYGCDRRFLRCWRHLFRSVDKRLRLLRIPEGLGDGGFITNCDEAAPSRHPTFDCWVTKNLIQKPLKFYDSSAGTTLTRLKSIRGVDDRYLSSNWQPSLDYGNFYNLRDRYQQRVAKLYVGNWYDLGPWW